MKKKKKKKKSERHTYARAGLVPAGKEGKEGKTFEKKKWKKNNKKIFTLKHKNSGYKYAKTHTSSVLR